MAAAAEGGGGVHISTRRSSIGCSGQTLVRPTNLKSQLPLGSADIGP